jgi:hypothetical protein
MFPYTEDALWVLHEWLNEIREDVPEVRPVAKQNTCDAEEKPRPAWVQTTYHLGVALPNLNRGLFLNLALPRQVSVVGRCTGLTHHAPTTL